MFFAGIAAAKIKKRKVGSFDSPVYATGAPGFKKLLFVVEQPGTVRVIRKGRKVGHAFLNLRRTLALHDGVGEVGHPG